MKLVDILARDLKDWPEGAVFAVQDLDGEVKFDNSKELPRINKSKDVWIRQGGHGDTLHSQELAEDCSCAIVTRAQWQAAVDALKAENNQENVIDIDWSKAPEGATHYQASDNNHAFRWLDMKAGEYGAVWFQGDWRLLNSKSYGNACIVPRPAAWTGEGLPPVGTVCEVIMIKSGQWEDCQVIAHTQHPSGMHVAVFTYFNPFRSSAFDVDYREASGFRLIRTPEHSAAEVRTRVIDDLVKVTCINRVEAARIFDAGYRKFEIVDEAT